MHWSAQNRTSKVDLLRLAPWLDPTPPSQSHEHDPDEACKGNKLSPTQWHELPGPLSRPTSIVFCLTLQTCGKAMDRKEVCADQQPVQRIKVILLSPGGPINSTHPVGFRV